MLADGARQVEVAAGDAADVVAGEVDVDLRVGEHDVGVVVGGLGRLGDAGDELEPRGEATASIAPAVMAMASYSAWSCSNVMSLPIVVSYTNVTPRRSTSRVSISMASRGRRKAGTPMSIVPPAYGRLSKTVHW